MGRVEAALANPILSYGAIVALQLRVIWNVWQYKDLTNGDTSFYFIDAASWAHGLHENIVYSPLYAMLWGTILAVVHDVYVAATVNRVAIVLLAAVLVLALMRSLLGPAMGLLIAAWWAVVPANFNVLYDVHMFGILPILIAALVVARVPRRSGLGIALGLLLGDALLVRNEVLLASVIFALAIVVHEVRGRRSDQVPMSTYVRAYGMPVAIVCLLVGGAYWRSHVQGHDMRLGVEAKQETNLCESYAFNYQQRYPSRVPGSPFTGCAPIMQHDFGSPTPSFLAATIANPRAMAGFVAWNARLLPSGLQVALFDATSTGDAPGYRPIEEHRSYALALSILLAGVLIAGFLALRGDREYWRRKWLPPRAWTVVLLGSVVAGTLVVVATERPWAEYMYGLTIGVLATAGLSLSALLRRVAGTRLFAWIAGGLTVMLIVALPSYYQPAQRPLYDAVTRVGVIRRQLQHQGSILVASQESGEICNYLAQTFARYCGSVSWPTLRVQVAPGVPIQAVLDRAHATAIYADATMLSDPVISGLLTVPSTAGWRQVAGGIGPGGAWRLLVRVQASH